MEKQKRFHLTGWTRPTRERKESDGVPYDLGHYDTLEDAEYVRDERLTQGWGRVVIIDNDVTGANGSSSAFIS